MKPRHSVSIFLLAALILLCLSSFLNVRSEAEEYDKMVEIKSVEERRILLSLQEEKEKLEERKKLLDTREMELKNLETEVDKKLNQLTALREETQKILAQKENEEAVKIGELSKVYDKMDPVKAASILADLRDDLVVDILAGMKKKTAASILSNLDPDRAAALSKSFSSLK